MLPLIFINTHPIQYVAPFYQYLASQGMPLMVVYHSDRSMGQNMDTEFGRPVQWDIPLLAGYNHQFLPNKGWGDPAKKGFWSLFNPGVFSFLKKQPRSLVVVHSWNFASQVMAIIGAKFYGHRVAFRGESNYLHEQAKNPIKKAIKNIYLKGLFSFVDFFLVIGKQNQRFYEAAGIAPKRLISVPYGVDNARFQQAAAQNNRTKTRLALGLAETDFWVLFSGKFIPKKRPMDLLRAVAHIPAIKLMMVGEGALRPEMEAFIADHQMKDRVLLTGFVNQREIPAYYAMADLMVMCSGTGETWGLSVNEAMNFCLPVVVSHLTGCAEDLVEPGKNGFIFETGNVTELTQQILAIYQLPQQQRQAMGKQSLRIVSEYSYAQMKAGIEKAASG